MTKKAQTAKEESVFLKAILSEDNELLTPYPIEDVTARCALITAAEKMEQMIKDQTILVGVEVVSKTPWGLNIKCKVEQPKADKPYIFYFMYSVDAEVLKNWMAEHKYFDGLFRFESRGITIVFPGGDVEDHHKVMFFIETAEGGEHPGDPIYLDLLITESTFAVHRDVFSNKEWVVSGIKI